jgi:ERF superfamily
MHRSSESIAALAAALAKAQSELSNPEKSLVGTIGTDRPGEGARTFRYAPLSSGLDIVRKALGQQQIATVQATAIDAATGTINLTTVLAHASGEWIASDWPVCRLADTAAPHRMGAALTYARRYALFTLVGIAGEDDLDAPDLNASPLAKGGNIGSTSAGRAATGSDNQPRPRGNGKDMLRPMLDPETSATLRDRLVHEIAGLGSADAAAEWARTALPAKNTLTESDARLVQLAFELRLSALEGDAERRQDDPQSPLTGPNEIGSTEPSGPSWAASEPSSPAEDCIERHSGQTRLGGIDKSVLSISEVRRYRDKDHIKFVASHVCLVCGRKPSDPHHLRFAQVRALGRKVSDEFTVPLCRLHHRELHRARNEADWWARLGIDALQTARKLWEETRSPGESASSTEIQPGPAGPTPAIPPKPRAGRRTQKAPTPPSAKAAPNRA